MGYIFIDIEKLNWVRHSRFERRGGDIKQKGPDLSARILALEASQKLEWNIEELTLEGVRFDVPMSIKSHGEEITVSIQEGSDGEISVRSQSIAMQLVDYGKNRKNIQSLQKAMEEIKSTLSPERLRSIRIGVAINPFRGMKKLIKDDFFSISLRYASSPHPESTTESIIN